MLYPLSYEGAVSARTSGEGRAHIGLQPTSVIATLN